MEIAFPIISRFENIIKSRKQTTTLPSFSCHLITRDVQQCTLIIRMNSYTLYTLPSYLDKKKIKSNGNTFNKQ